MYDLCIKTSNYNGKDWNQGGCRAVFLVACFVKSNKIHDLSINLSLAWDIIVTFDNLTMQVGRVLFFILPWSCRFKISKI